MFKALISKDLLDLWFTKYFRNLGMIQATQSIDVTELEFDGDDLIVDADLSEEQKLN